MSKKLRWVLALAVALTAVFIYAFVDPAVTWWMPKCPVNLLTGLSCPGCGSQRALHAILHGELVEALRYNALLVLMVPFLCLSGYAELRRDRHPVLYRRIMSPFTVAVVIILITVWTVGRNLYQ